MAPASLVVFAFLSLASAGLYLIIGRHASRTSFTPAGARGAGLFRFWWWGLASMAAISGIEGLLAVFASDAPWIAFAATSAQLFYVLGASFALCGLMCYLWFLYTGSMRASPFFVFFYALVYVAAGASIVWQHVTGFVAFDYAVDVAYATMLPESGIVYVGFFSLFLIPQMLVAGLYLALYRRVGDRRARLRVVLVAASLLLLLTLTFAAGVTGHFHDAWWLSAQPAIELLASAGVLLAHRPPRWVRERYEMEAPAVGTARFNRMG